ncbi:hypothetical protein [Microcoleus sp. FACHB-831]|nr:hypothetical protein [Microcoleus sp. FACHB-831]
MLITVSILFFILACVALDAIRSKSDLGQEVATMRSQGYIAPPQ